MSDGWHSWAVPRLIESTADAMRTATGSSVRREKALPFEAKVFVAKRAPHPDPFAASQMPPGAHARNCTCACSAAQDALPVREVGIEVGQVGDCGREGSSATTGMERR